MSDGGGGQGELQTPLDILGIMASQQAMLGPDLRHIEMYTRRGLLSILWHEPAGEARNVGVVMVGGAMGGVMGPGEALYHVLGEDFSARGIGERRVDGCQCLEILDRGCWCRRAAT